MSEPKIFKKRNRPAEITGEFVIPEGYTKIAESAFEDCTGLTSIKIPSSVTEIGYYAFYGCTGLTSIEIPNSVTEIGDGAFRDCTGLTSIEIPNSVTEIVSQAFCGCTGLTSIEIPDSVTKIGSSAFYDCTSLTSIEIPNSVTEIGSSAFNGCTGLTSIEIPNSVTEIGSSAFKGCTGLTSIEIPDSVTKIKTDAFEGCTGLTHIVVDEDNPTYTYLDGFLLTKDRKELVMYFGGINVVIPDSVETIGAGAFYNCTSLTSIEIPNSVTKIGNWAFSGCSGLTSIKIPSSVTEIGTEAFRFCRGLTSIEIPDSVTEIGDNVFIFCDSLTLFTYPKGLKFKKKDVFGSTGYKKIKFVTSGAKDPEEVADANTDTVRGCIQGEVVCVSGKFKDHTQEEMEALVVGNGATVSASVTKKTTILVTGDKVGATKLTKAQELGIRIIPQDEFFKMVASESASSSENLTSQEVHVKFGMNSHSRWNLYSISKDGLQKFISKYSDEEINLDEEEGVERASEILEENMADFWEAFGCWPDDFNIWERPGDLTLTVSKEDDELEFTGEELEGVPVEEENIKSEEGDGFTVISETTAKYPTYEADIEIEGDFDINKLSVVNHIVEYDGNSYCWQDILYNGEKIDLELTYDRVISDEISLKKD